MNFIDKKKWFINYLKQNDMDMYNHIVNTTKQFGELPEIEYTGKDFVIKINNVNKTISTIKLRK